MNFTQYIYFDFFSIGALIPSLLLGLLGYFFIKIKNKSRASLHLGIAMTVSSFFYFAYFVSASVYHPLTAFHRWFTVITVILQIFNFALAFFSFPDVRFSRFREVFITMTYLISALIIALFFKETYNAEKVFVFAGHYWDFDAEKSSKVLSLFVVLLIFFILFAGITRGIVNRGIERWAALSMGVVFFISLIIPGITNVLSRDGLLDRGTYQLTQNLSSITGVFIVVMIFLNVTKDRSSFMSKILIVSITTLLVMVQGFTYYSLQDLEKSFDLLLRSETKLTIKTAIYPDDMEYMASYSFKDGTVSSKYLKGKNPLTLDFSEINQEFYNTLIYEKIKHLDKTKFNVELENLLSGTNKLFSGYKSAIFEYTKTVSPEEKDPAGNILLYIDSIERQVLYTKNKISQLPDEDFIDHLNEFLPDAKSKIFNRIIYRHLETASPDQKLLKKEILSYLTPMRKSGARIYRKDFSGKKHYVAVMEADPVKNSVVEAGYPYLNYRNYVHETSKKYIIMLLIMVCVVIFGFPLFFWGSLIKPIRNLLSGLQEMQKGNLKIQIPVRVEDEFGFMSRNFNKMSENIERNDRELINIRSFLSNIIESMPSMLISVDGEGVVTQWNHAAEMTTGIKAMDILGRNIWTATDIFNEYQEICRDILDKREAVHLYRKKFEGPPVKYENVSLYPLVANGITGMVIRMDDITELEKKEEQLRQAQKMETVGTLAGGLAHDFNNVLSGIVGTVSLMKYDIHAANGIEIEVLKDYVQTIESAGHRAADMVQQLLSLSGKRESSFVPVDLNQIIKHVFKLCSNTIDKSVDLKPFYTQEPAMVNADPGQMEQVVLNLCVNAGHAMTFMRPSREHQGGVLAISLKRIQPDRFFCSTHSEAREISYWVLSVQDTGIGMDSKTAAKIFDPFFTTKEKGKGTGLGLAMVYNIVQQHGGFIDVYSELGIGTSINVYLPVTEDVRGAAELMVHEKIFAGEGVVLVVDDELIMRELARKILEKCGYKVLLAENGEEGVELFRKEHEKVAMVLLDLVMPKKSGKEAFTEMKKIDPGVKVLLTSGFKEDDRVKDIMKLGIKGFIQKPYTLEKLTEAIRKIIQEE